jgi:hypoxanthine-guanine phosphoribosyltransferase
LLNIKGFTFSKSLVKNLQIATSLSLLAMTRYHNSIET